MTTAKHFYSGNNPAMVQLKQLMMVCAQSEASVLILGETGTGKEVLCRELHQNSSRNQAPIVPINCAAIPGSLLESELFGYTKGSFTGASSDRIGRLELANGGTLFLDEIGDMPLELQPKMLRVIEDRVVEPLGGGKSKAVNVRIIAATHRDLYAMVAEGTFREDLYHRINVIPLAIPPVRERKEDIPHLCHFFAKKHANRGQRPITFTPKSAEILQEYEWPGNVREVSNLVMRFSVIYSGQQIDITNVPIYVLCEQLNKIVAQHSKNNLTEACPAAYHKLVVDDQYRDNHTDFEAQNGDCMPAKEFIKPETIEDALRLCSSVGIFPRTGIASKQIIADIEIQLIKAALTQSDLSISKAAKLLQLQRTTLIQKMTRYNISTSFL